MRQSAGVTVSATSERGQDGEHVGERQRPEERAGEAIEKEHRQENKDHDEAGDRPPRCALRCEALSTTWNADSGLPASAIQPQPAQDVLHVDDRVVDHFAEGDDEAGEDHRIHACRRENEAITAAASSESGMAVRLMRAVRQSNRKSDQDHHHERAAEQQRVAEIVRASAR